MATTLLAINEFSAGWNDKGFAQTTGGGGASLSQVDEVVFVGSVDW